MGEAPTEPSAENFTRDSSPLDQPADGCQRSSRFTVMRTFPNLSQDWPEISSCKHPFVPDANQGAQVTRMRRNFRGAVAGSGSRKTAYSSPPPSDRFSAGTVATGSQGVTRSSVARSS